MPKQFAARYVKVVIGVVSIAVAAATIVASSVLEFPMIERSPQSVAVNPEPSAKQLVCPGSVLQLGGEGGQNASVAVAIDQPATTRAATEGEVDVAALQQTNGASASPGAPMLLTVPASTGSASVSVAGAQYQAVDSGDYRGLAAANCAEPSSDTWLVGGSTAVGRTTLLTLANPGAVASTIAIEIYNSDGLVDASGTTGIVVAASSQRVISLAGFAPGSASLAVHVTSSGGPIAANLQEAIVRGIEPSGVEIIGPTATPSTVNVMPGVLILSAEEVAARLGEEGFGDLDTTLRVVVPGDKPAQATVTIVPADPTLPGASFELQLDAGVVTDVPIEGLFDGAYVVRVDSTVPLSAALRSSTVATQKVGETPVGASDLAWFGSATALGDTAFASVAPGPGASLHLGNLGDLAVTFTLTSPTGPSTVTVNAGASLVLEVSEATSYLINGASGLFASVSFAAPGQLASYSVSSAANDEEPVTIYP